MQENISQARRLRKNSKEFTDSFSEALIEKLCASEDLSTYDPYDIWKTSLGFRVKHLYNCHPRMGLVPAGALSLFDNLANNNSRMFYTTQEYPVVRAVAALSLLNLYRGTARRELLEHAERHLLWLLAHSCRGYSGPCWGLGFPHAVSGDVVYDSGTPFSTITPYALEAFVRFSEASQDPRFHSVIAKIFDFFDRDLKVMEEDEEALATSYGPFRDRTVINAVSYTMYSYALCLPYVPLRRKLQTEAKIRKLYAYVRRNQRADGSWFYSPNGRSFIDCFHSCIVLKNVIKTSRMVELENAESVVAAGYEYVRKAFLDEDRLLFRRFSVSNKFGLIRFDLYDNAEAMNLALLLGDSGFAAALLQSVARHFCKGQDIYSQIDIFGERKNKNMLRWAVMPLLYAVSQMALKGNSWTPQLTKTSSSR